MEYLVLKKYLEFKQEKKRTFKAVLKKMPVKNKIALIILLISFILFIIFYAIKNVKFLLCSCFIGILSAIYLNVSQNHLNIQQSQENIEAKDTYYENLQKILAEIGYTTRNQVAQLCCRCEVIIEKEKEREKEEINLVDKVFSAIIFPIGVTSLSFIFQSVDNNTLQVQGLVILVLVILLYLAIRYLAKEIGGIPMIKYDMCSMVEDLHGILDRKFLI